MKNRWLIMMFILLGGALPSSGFEQVGEAGVLNLSAPEMQRLKRDYQHQTEVPRQARRRDLERLLQESLEWAHAELETQMRSGNLTGTAVARAAIRLFETCAEELGGRGDFVVPDRVRRELVDRLKRLEESKSKLEEKYAGQLGAEREIFFDQFTEIAQIQIRRHVADSELKEWFTELVGTGLFVPAAVESREAVETPAAAGPSPPSPAAVLASSGEADDWVTIGRWFAEVDAMELFSMPVAHVSEEREHSGLGMMTRAPYRTRYLPQYALQPTRETVFRIHGISGYLGADVAQWPSARNHWTLEVRVRPGDTAPSRHAFELQVNADAVQAGLRDQF